MLALMLDPIFKGMCLINNYVVMKMKTIKNLAKMQTIKVYSRSKEQMQTHWKILCQESYMYFINILWSQQL
jgi:hypothetical protein